MHSEQGCNVLWERQSKAEARRGPSVCKSGCQELMSWPPELADHMWQNIQTKDISVCPSPTNTSHNAEVSQPVISSLSQPTSWPQITPSPVPTPLNLTPISHQVLSIIPQKKKSLWNKSCPGHCLCPCCVWGFILYVAMCHTSHYHPMCSLLQQPVVLEQILKFRVFPGMLVSSCSLRYNYVPSTHLSRPPTAHTSIRINPSIFDSL